MVPVIVEITTIMKNLLTLKRTEMDVMLNTKWASSLNSVYKLVNFSFGIPLNLLFGFAEDYKRIILNVKQEFVLILSSTDNNAVLLNRSVNKYKLTLSTIHWGIPYVHVSDEYRLQLLKIVDEILRSP